MNLFKVLLLFFIILVNLDALKSSYLEDNLESNLATTNISETLSFDGNYSSLYRSKRSSRSKANKRRKVIVSEKKVTTKAPRLIENAEMANCETELHSVEFKYNYFELIWPTGTRVKRCGGCCLDPRYECQPTKTRTRYFSVSTVHYKKGIHFSTPNQAIQEVEEHVNCRCQCRTKENDCTSAQVYDKDSCRCSCPNSEDYQKCKQLGSTNYIWNYDTCICDRREDY